LVVFNGHLFNEQSDIGLSQRGIVGPKAVTQHLPESANHFGRNAALAGHQLLL
jgi:hypothetical protein